VPEGDAEMVAAAIRTVSVQRRALGDDLLSVSQLAALEQLGVRIEPIPVHVSTVPAPARSDGASSDAPVDDDQDELGGPPLE
jgi:hypothetical protein